MSYVFFDLEWNQGYPRSEADKLDEIIQFGAFKLEDWSAEGEMFSAYVRPSVHRKLHHRVRKMLPLDQADLYCADRFPVAVDKFFSWCGEDAVFFTWGPSDAKVLDCNLAWYGMEEYLSIEIYDLQRAFDLMIRKTDQQTALKDAVEYFHLEAISEFHDACNDACYTGRIAAKMIALLGELPSLQMLEDRGHALHRERQEQAARQAADALAHIYQEEEYLLESDCGLSANESDCLKSRSARVFRCPKCETLLCNGNWFRIGHCFAARSRCMEHGRFYTILMQEQVGDKWHGVCRVFTDDQLPSSLFSLCKLGGEVINVRKLPRKRSRGRKRSRTKTLTVKPVENED